MPNKWVNKDASRRRARAYYPEGCQHDDDVHLPGSPPSAEVLEEMTRVSRGRILS